VQLQLSLDFHKIQVSFLFFPLLAAQGMAPADGTCASAQFFGRTVGFIRKEEESI
jgi:hypothetical protein